MIALAIALALWLAADADSVVVGADRMIDVSSGQMVEKPQVTITDGRISAVGKQGDVGSIALGRFGDLVGIAGNPLVDVKLLEKISFVMKGGELVRAPGSQRP